jgi:hypothetical protein
MILVIQCAASKRPNAGHFRARDGKKVLFVADPARAPASADLIYARPDDRADDGVSWREHVARYNATPEVNPFGLSPAYELYENETYRDLVRKFGLDNVMILSAGWGLIPARFLTPRYDITFSASAEPYVRRRKNQAYGDFSKLPARAGGPIVFFGGREYVPLFAKLTTPTERRIVFYNSAVPPAALGCFLKRFHTSTRTNWHYECARAFIAGAIEVA